MRELDAIVLAFDHARASQIDCVLATVVHVEGSSYRKAGARMLIDEYGQMTGAISGGCLEGDALRKALHALHQRKNKLITYDTSDESDAVIGAQLGCNGVIEVLFEPIDPTDSDNPIELLRQVIHSTEQQVIISLFDLNKSNSQIGTKLVIDQSIKCIGNLKNDALKQWMLAETSLVFHQQHSHYGAFPTDDGQQTIFFQLHHPPPHLVLVGAGNDTQILASMAEQLGWKVTVTDGRPSHANASRFSNSCQVIVSKPEHVLEEVALDERTFFVLISHNYQYDLEVLKLLYDKLEVPYIGILGPKAKYNRMLGDLEVIGIEFTEAQSKRIHAPVGLNIGADTPAEIALSILAEIQAELTNTDSQRLRDKDGPIHEKPINGIKATSL
ncbi:XdhC family protein [Marinoscillum sp.]|uniref:XdhC family protein n=1 Tax=Marinoscillum sp. TaxID=2024838 RepID=UPI003BA85A1F